MMGRIVIWFTLLLFTCYSMAAQKVRLAEPKMGHTLFGQIFWSNKDYYVSYDKLWLRKWQYAHLSTTVGFWYDSREAPTSLGFNRLWEQKLRLQFSGLAGKNGHYAVIGISRYFQLDNGRDPSGWISLWETFYDHLHLGYRYQHPNGGVFFQALYFIPFCCSGFTLIPYESFSLGLGITFPIKPQRPWYLPEGYKN